MRRALAIGAALGLTGCVSNWTDYGIDKDCQEVLLFTDADADGWGDPDADGDGTLDEGFAQCPPLPANTARNNRDCDDTTGLITGRVGSLCPNDLVDTQTDFTPVIVGNEFVLVHPDTTVVWAAAAEQACGPFGWGGGLATFQNAGQLQEVLGGLGDTTIYAGFVGFHPTLHEWGQYDDAGTWVKATDGTDFAVTLCNCKGGADPDTCDDRYTADLGYLALIRDGSSALDAWCLGTPEEALPASPAGTEPPYELLYGHFICERPIPDPNDWNLALPEDVAAE